MKLKVTRAATRIDSSSISSMNVAAVPLGGYEIKTNGFVQIYSVQVSFTPGTVPFTVADGVNLEIRYGSVSGPLACEPLPMNGFLDSAELAGGILQPISCRVLPGAPIVARLTGSATGGNGVLDVLAVVHDPVMRVLDDDF